MANQNPGWISSFSAVTAPIILLLLAIGSIMFYLMPPNEERLKIDSAQISATRDMELASQRTKQIVAASQALRAGVSATQVQAIMPEVVQMGQQPAVKPVPSERHVESMPRGDQWVIDDSMDYIITGYRDDERAVTILAMSIPTTIVGGEYMFVYQADPSQRAWSRGWSSEVSPEDPFDFLKRHRQPMGGTEYVNVYVRGKIRFYMK
jgi:hypothetical protein